MITSSIGRASAFTNITETMNCEEKCIKCQEVNRYIAIEL
jgi:hypothetical protein